MYRHLDLPLMAKILLILDHATVATKKLNLFLPLTYLSPYSHQIFIQVLTLDIFIDPLISAEK